MVAGMGVFCDPDFSAQPPEIGRGVRSFQKDEAKIPRAIPHQGIALLSGSMTFLFRPASPVNGELVLALGVPGFADFSTTLV